MYTIETGLFPIAGLLVGGALYLVERCVLRLKCTARWAQAFIAVALLLTTVCSLTTLCRVVEATVVEASAPSTAVGASRHDTTGDAASTFVPAYDTAGEVIADSTSDAPVGVLVPSAHGMPLVRLIYIIGVLAVVVFFVCQIAALWLYRRRQQPTDDKGVYLTDGAEPFSFGRTILLPRSLTGDVRRYVLLHEQAHLRHRHFLKLCLMQLFVALCWYNPFVWLLFGEMRLQQELEVDVDVLRSGVDRQRYQLALLSVCAGQPGRWILLHSTFHLQPLKQRIIFMNTYMNHSQMWRRKAAAAIIALLVFASAVAAGCQTHIVESSSARHHPLRGCWTMDWISNTGSGVEVHPVAMHYGFYNDTTFLCFSYWKRKGVNMHFSMSGEGYTWRGDTLVSADGRPTDYTFIDDCTVVSRWWKDSTQMAGVAGPDITEQWHSIKPCADIVKVFRTVAEARNGDPRLPEGVWLKENAADPHRQTYFLAHDSIFMWLDMHPSTVVEGFRYGASGFCGELTKELEQWISLTDDGRLELTIESGKPAERFRRIDMPATLLRTFGPAVSIEQNE